MGDIEMELDADKNRDIPVVIRFHSGKFYICHAKSYQNAFRSSVNGFDTREEAEEFAENHDCEVHWHDYDILQSK